MLIAGVDFEWNPNNWSYNLFRLWEVVFGRRCDINGGTLRFESRAAIIEQDGETVRVYEFGTLEALITHAELLLRYFFRTRFKLGFKRVPVPQFAFAGIPTLPSPFLFAIAFVVVDHNVGNPTNSLTITHAPAGSNIGDVLFVLNFQGGNNNAVTGATDNGSTMTQLDNSTGFSSSGFTVSTFFLNPATSGNIVINASASIALSGVVMSYSGNAGGVDTHTLLLGSAATTFSTTLVTNTANEFIVAVGQSNNQSVSGTWGQSTRFSDGIVLNGNYGDKSFASAGTQTISFSQSTGADWDIQAVSLKPLAAVVVNAGFFFAAAR